MAALGFAFKAILVKLAYAASPTLDALTLLTLRMLYAAPAFAWLSWRESRQAPALTNRQWFVIALLGMLGYYGASLLDFMGLQYISAGLERLVLAVYPTLTLLLAALLFGEKLTLRKMLACALCYAGLAVAFIHDLSFATDTSALWLGSGLVFASAVSYALYLIGSGKMIAALGSQRFAALAMLVSSGGILFHFALFGAFSHLAQPWQVHQISLAMAVFSTVIPVLALAAAIRRIGAPSTALMVRPALC